MTNADIIFSAQLDLMEQGKIGTTGRMLKYVVTVNGKQEERTLAEPEPIHTFQRWKELGFKVKKGEHAIAKFGIWKYAGKAPEDDEEEDTRRMFMKTSCFFSLAQVERKEA